MMQRKFFCRATVAALAAVASGCATYGTPLSRWHGDEAFMDKAMSDTIADAEAAKLAQRETKLDSVRALAARASDDDARASARLKAIAAGEHVALPAGADRSAERDLEQLRSASGAAFDREYVERAITTRQDAIRAFEGELKSGSDPQIKAFASQTLPTLQQQLQLAEAAQAAVQQEVAKANAANPGLKAAREGTGATRSAVERADRMPIPKAPM